MGWSGLARTGMLASPGRIGRRWGAIVVKIWTQSETTRNGPLPGEAQGGVAEFRAAPKTAFPVKCRFDGNQFQLAV
mgnify:CR=1 FL=1